MRRPTNHTFVSDVSQIVVNPLTPPTNPLTPVVNPIPPVTNPLPPVIDPIGTSPTTTSPTTGTGPGGGQSQVTQGEVDQSDKAVNGPAARSGGLTGAGIKIGIISNSFNLYQTASTEEAAGLLPASGVTVLEEGPVGSDDEGQAMAELVHATAPGAQLYFYSGFYSEADMAAGIAALQAAGCQIIVDDIGYADSPMFQVAGPIDDAVQTAVSDGVDYFTAVGNDGDGDYQAACAPQRVFINGIGTVWAQTFAGGATTQTVTIPAGSTTTLSLDWDAPYNADNADTITVMIMSGDSVIATSTQSGTEPVVLAEFPQIDLDRTYNIAIVYSSGSGQPSLFKYVLFGGGTIADPAGGEATGAAFGQALVPGANAVGAVNVADTPAEGGTLQPEEFSSTGGSELLFAPNGTALTDPEATDAPGFLAPDGSATSVFDPFDGTSAAAPVAAATAALMLQANRSLSNADLTILLDDSAIPAGATTVAGAGLIQANLATRYASTGVISGSPQTMIQGISAACTIQGGSGSHWLVAGSGSTLLQSQGTDSVQAGAGADTVDLTGASAQLWGSTGDTWVRTLGGTDTVVGDSGGLTVSGGAGGGVIFGSTVGDNDLTAGDQQTLIVSRGTGDVLVGNGNGDQLYASDLGNETLVGGGSGQEYLVGGTSGTDIFQTGAGWDVVATEGSTAVVTFGTGQSTVVDGTGANLLQVVNGQAGGFEAVYSFDASRDLLLLSGFDDEQAAAQASIADQYDTGGNSWVKLPDGTVIAFVGVSHFDASSVTYG